MSNHDQKILVPDLIQAGRFLTRLDEGATEFCFQTFDDFKSRKTKALAGIRFGAFEKWADYLTKMNQSGAGIFVTVNETDGKGRKLSNIIRIRAIWHEEDTPCGKDFPIEPHLLIESSPGKYHRYWFVDGLSQADFSGVMARMIRDYGSDPNVKDTARVLRVPGFYHLKNPEQPFMVRILSESGGLPYSGRQILTAFSPIMTPQTLSNKAINKRTDGAVKAQVAELASRAARRTQENPNKGRHTQILWLGFECAQRGIPIDCADYALKIFANLMRETDTTGKAEPINFASEIEAFKKSYDKGLKAPHTGHVQETERRPEPPLDIYAADVVALTDTTKPRKPRKKKPEIQPDGDSAAQWLKIINRYVYIRQLNRFFDVVTRNSLTREGIDGGYCHLFQETNRISLKLLNDPECKKADVPTYLYGEKTNPIINKDGSVEWNVYSPDPDIILPDRATDKDVEPWIKHLEYLFEIENEREHLLDWFAHLFQKPNKKINHAPLLGGNPGIGKDMLLQAIIYGLGAINVCQPPASELKENFTDFLYHTKLIIFQEASNFEKREIEDKLKPILASPPYKLRVRLFNSGFYTIPNEVQVIFMSNHKDSLHISDNDRRYFAVWSEAKPNPAKYYTDLAQWMDAGGNGAVVRWLKTRDIKSFNPKADPPITSFKRQLMNTSKSPLKKLLIDKIKAFDPPFDCDIVRSDDIAKALLPERYTTRAIGLVLDEIKCFQRTCYKYQNGKRTKISLFAVRNVGEEVDDDGPKKGAALAPGTGKDKPINWRSPEKSKDKLWLEEYIKGDSDRHAKWGGVVPDDENRVDWNGPDDEKNVDRN